MLGYGSALRSGRAARLAGISQRDGWRPARRTLLRWLALLEVVVLAFVLLGDARTHTSTLAGGSLAPRYLVQVPALGLVPAAESPAPAAPASARPAPEPALAGQLVIGAIQSAILGRTLTYHVYLPPGYAASNRHYPTLYMLHGLNGSCETWPSYGLASAADSLIVAGQIQPFIVVMPEGDRGYWLNHANGGPRWGDYLLDEVVPTIDRTYRTIPARESRAIGGNSMGGHGALQTAINHPELFAVAGAHSPGLRRYNETFPFFGDQAYYAAHDPLTLARTSESVSQLAIWIDTGEEDPWRGRALELHDVLVARGILHQWHVWPGKHDRTYWHAHVEDYLRFYAGALKRDG